MQSDPLDKIEYDCKNGQQYPWVCIHQHNYHNLYSFQYQS